MTYGSLLGAPPLTGLKLVPDGDKAWMAEGACRGTDADMWFPGRGEPLTQQRAICAGCPVRVQCLEYALRKNEHWGFWGGCSERERRRIRAQRRLP